MLDWYAFASGPLLGPNVQDCWKSADRVSPSQQGSNGRSHGSGTPLNPDTLACKLPHAPNRVYSRPVWELLDRAASQVPAQIACRYNDQTWTYESLRADVLRMTGMLERAGIGRGDRVALLLPNIPEMLVAFYAIWRRGAIVVSVSPLMVQEEVRKFLNEVECRHVVALDLLAHLLPTPQQGLQQAWLVSLRERLPGYQQVGYFLSRLKRTRQWSPTSPAHADWLADSLCDCEPLAETPTFNPNQTPAFILPTGGTTGSPKSVVLSHRNLVANAMQQAAHAGATMGEEKLMGVLPFFHSYGLSAVVLGGAALGAELILHHRFNTSHVLDLIERQHPSVLHAVPAMLVAMNAQLRRHPRDIQSLKWVISGGASLEPEVAEEFAKHSGAVVVEGYGLSEASPVTHSGPLDGSGIAGTIGHPLRDTECQIVDRIDGHTNVLPGDVGELIVRGPQVMLGYWKDPAATTEAIRGDWLYTGDLACQDAAGNYRIVERKKDLVITSGYNVFPREVEAVLRRAPQIADVAIIGIPDPERGEIVKAIIRTVGDRRLNEASLQAFCKKHLAAYKRPRVFEQIQGELPKNFLGKIQRRKLRSQPPHDAPAVATQSEKTALETVDSPLTAQPSMTTSIRVPAPQETF